MKKYSAWEVSKKPTQISTNNINSVSSDKNDSYNNKGPKLGRMSGAKCRRLKNYLSKGVCKEEALRLVKLNAKDANREISSMLLGAFETNRSENYAATFTKNALEEKPLYKKRIVEELERESSEAEMDQRKEFFRQLGLPRHEVYEWAKRSFKIPNFDINHFRNQRHELRSQRIGQTKADERIVEEIKKLYRNLLKPDIRQKTRNCDRLSSECSRRSVHSNRSQSIHSDHASKQSRYARTSMSRTPPPPKLENWQEYITPNQNVNYNERRSRTRSRSPFQRGFNEETLNLNKNRGRAKQRSPLRFERSEQTSHHWSQENNEFREENYHQKSEQMGKLHWSNIASSIDFGNQCDGFNRTQQPNIVHTDGDKGNWNTNFDRQQQRDISRDDIEFNQWNKMRGLDQHKNINSFSNERHHWDGKQGGNQPPDMGRFDNEKMQWERNRANNQQQGITRISSEADCQKKSFRGNHQQNTSHLGNEKDQWNLNRRENQQPHMARRNNEKSQRNYNHSGNQQPDMSRLSNEWNQGLESYRGNQQTNMALIDKERDHLNANNNRHLQFKVNREQESSIGNRGFIIIDQNNFVRQFPSNSNENQSNLGRQMFDNKSYGFDLSDQFEGNFNRGANKMFPQLEGGSQHFAKTDYRPNKRSQTFIQGSDFKKNVSFSEKIPFNNNMPRTQGRNMREEPSTSCPQQKKGSSLPAFRTAAQQRRFSKLKKNGKIDEPTKLPPKFVGGFSAKTRVKAENFGDVIPGYKPPFTRPREFWENWWKTYGIIEQKVLHVDDHDPELLNVINVLENASLETKSERRELSKYLKLCEQTILKSLNDSRECGRTVNAYDFLKARVIMSVPSSALGKCTKSGRRSIANVKRLSNGIDMCNYFFAIIYTWKEAFGALCAPNHPQRQDATNLMKDKVFNWLVQLAFKQIKLISMPLMKAPSREEQLRLLYTQVSNISETNSDVQREFFVPMDFKTQFSENMVKEKIAVIENFMKTEHDAMTSRPAFKFMKARILLTDKTWDDKINYGLKRQKDELLATLDRYPKVQACHEYLLDKLINTTNRHKYLNSIHRRLKTASNLREANALKSFIKRCDVRYICHWILKDRMEKFKNFLGMNGYVNTEDYQLVRNKNKNEHYIEEEDDDDDVCIVDDFETCILDDYDDDDEDNEDD